MNPFQLYEISRNVGGVFAERHVSLM